VILQLRLFAAARQHAGVGVDDFELPTGAGVDDVLAAAVARYGEGFAQVLAKSRVWVNGDEPPRGVEAPLADGDEVAVLPPVSGGYR
jgi:molybdopterin synthase sulfur carrier subunit